MKDKPHITHLTIMTLEAFIAWLRHRTNEMQTAARLENVKRVPHDAKCFTPRTLEDWIDSL